MGEEMILAWEILHGEAQQSAEWLETDLEGTLAANIENIGEGSVTGKTRTRIMEQMELTRSQLLDKALAEYGDQAARPCWSWANRDKLSAAWLLTVSGLTAAEFSEAATSHLCLPSPACINRVGETVRGDTKMDIYGDRVRSVAHCGAGYRHRHDLIKHFLLRQMKFAGIQVECEIFNLFVR